MIRKNKLFKRPKKAYESARIKEENVIKEKYGLKNKREIWKTSAKINYFRSRAKILTKADEEERDLFLEKLRSLGLNTNTLSDVLALNIEDLLKRRLPTIVVKKGLATTMRQARQLVTHKKVLVDGNVVNSPSYIVALSDENKISIKVKAKKPKPAASEAPVEAAQ